MEVATGVAGLAILIVLLAAAVRFLGSPKHRYPEPRERRPFRETMTTWLMGPRN